MIRCALALCLFAVVPQEDPKPVPKPAGETAIAKKDTFRIDFQLDGSFEPAERHVVQLRLETFQGDLPVAKVAAHGTKVKKDDVLLQIDLARFGDAMIAAELATVSAKAQHDRTVEEMKASEATEALAQERMERETRDAMERLRYFTDTEMALQVKDAERNLQSQEDYLGDQKDELDQLEKMYKSEELTNATADIVVKRARRQLERTKVQIESMKVRLERAKIHTIPMQLEQMKVAAREAAIHLENFKKGLPFTRAEKAANLARVRVAVKSAEDGIARLRRDEMLLKVTAPADGVFFHGVFEGGAWSQVDEMKRMLRVGEKARAGQVLATLVTGLRVKVLVQENRLADFQAGMAARTTVTAFPDLVLEGKADAPNLIGGRVGDSYETRIDLATSDPRLAPGLKAKVSVAGMEVKDVIVVPVQAVTEEAGRKIVRMKSETREVVVGRSNGVLVEIKSGLKEGDEVLLK